MKYSTKVSDAVHILSFIALNAKESLTSQAIAESVKTNPAFVRQMMSSLRNAGLLTSVKGHAKPALSRDAKDISLLDVYRAVEGDKPLLHQDTHTNPECGVGVNIQLVIRDCYDQVQKKAEEEMASISMQDIGPVRKTAGKAGTLISGCKMPRPPRLSFRLAESYNESNSNYRILCISVCFKAGCLTCGN